MTLREKAVIVIVVGSCFACADSRMQRPDEEAMMLYRECMNGTPAQWNSSEVSAALGSEHVASAGASADSRRESRQTTECMQRAGWEEK